MRYPLAPQGVYWTIQGEGHLSGVQMCFVRLAGCSVGCPNCDTDYRLSRRLTAAELADECEKVTPSGINERWVWITGGEPADYDLSPLVAELKKRRFLVAVATSGHKSVLVPVDWLSVSPHDPDAWVQRFGQELKLVPGLNGLDLDRFPVDAGEFWFRYIQPLDGSTGAEHVEWLLRHPNWSLTMQHHLLWGVE